MTASQARRRVLETMAELGEEPSAGDVRAALRKLEPLARRYEIDLEALYLQLELAKAR
jgi:hypothetical protein